MAQGQVVRDQTFVVGERYTELNYLGEGAYGMVVSAKDMHNGGKQVAIKKMILRDHLTYSRRALREIKILTRLDHECIVSIVELIANPEPAAIREVYVVMRRMESDLHQVIRALRKKRQLLPQQHTCYWGYQLAKALYYLHSANVLHRDLKPQNVLINSQSDCALAVCDFGLARVVDRSQPEKLSEYVATRWYRAPELALSLCEYTDQMDVWSFGCILAECLTGKPLFPSKTAMDQLNRILDLVGSPSDADLDWIPKETTREYVRRLPSRPRADFSQKFSGAPAEAVDLLDQIFQFDPRRRPNAKQLLEHAYFASYRDPDTEPVALHPLKREHADVDVHSMSEIQAEIAKEVERFNHTNIALDVANQALADEEPVPSAASTTEQNSFPQGASQTTSDGRFASSPSPGDVARSQSIPIAPSTNSQQSMLQQRAASLDNNTVAMGTTPDD
eukprot:TRINITY_DN12228_c1_g8_i1.p1 TRINITY_DN12228_c1_g8~~TRINITY_DN12228_c1_g8_i1.p1  ORF type:complete len:448 (+),score=89.43 TRINITY_DN12228_c1_g8_i1:121-1464(+)